MASSIIGLLHVVELQSLVSPTLGYNTSNNMAAKIGMKDLYLLSYNAACAVAWALVVKLALSTVVADLPEYGIKGALANVYGTPDLALILTWAQSAALLEIVHSALGLVRSPVMVTFMQVSSRIVALFALVNSPESQGKSSECDGWLSLFMLESFLRLFLHTFSLLTKISP